MDDKKDRPEEESIEDLAAMAPDAAQAAEMVRIAGDVAAEKETRAQPDAKAEVEPAQ